jgi:hypothetical protein
MINLGDEVKDLVSGFRGIAVARMVLLKTHMENNPLPPTS